VKQKNVLPPWHTNIVKKYRVQQKLQKKPYPVRVSVKCIQSFTKRPDILYLQSAPKPNPTCIRIS
jgi:hypothetical protein